MSNAEIQDILRRYHVPGSSYRAFGPDVLFILQNLGYSLDDINRISNAEIYSISKRYHIPL